MKTLALYSNKGGVGKTAAAVNLAYLAAKSGLVTLICDLDSQSSATYYFRVKPKLKPKAQGLIRGRKQVDRSIKGTDYENLDLLPADFTHRNLDITFNQQKSRKQQLKKILDPLRKEYDLIILDSPPTINILAENIFNAADNLLVPLIPSTLSVRTHTQLLSFLKENKFRSDSAHTFFSFVDGRKKCIMNWQHGQGKTLPVCCRASSLTCLTSNRWESIESRYLPSRLHPGLPKHIRICGRKFTKSY